MLRVFLGGEKPAHALAFFMGRKNCKKTRAERRRSHCFVSVPLRRSLRESRLPSFLTIRCLHACEAHARQYKPLRLFHFGQPGKYWFFPWSYGVVHGKVSVNRAPSPGTEDTDNSPCISSARARDSASPRPVPPCSLLTCALPWRNFSKISSCKCSGIPGPVSITWKRSCAP